MLGIAFDEDAAELVPRTGPLAYGDGLAAAKSLRETADKLINGPKADSRHLYGLCSCHNDFGDPIIPGRA